MIDGSLKKKSNDGLISEMQTELWADWKQNLKLLLLEDSEADAELILHKLRKAGLEFTERRVDSREGMLKNLSEFEPHLILADYSLPGFTAIDALRLLKDRRIDVPVILVTGSHSEEVAVECIKQGAEDYILKSSLKRLPSAVLNSLKKREAERRRAASETAFRRSEAMYRLIAENTRDLVAVVDLRFKCVYASPSHETVLGYGPAELLGASRATLFHPDERKLVEKTLANALISHESQRYETQLRHKDGHWLLFESVMGVILDDQKQPQQVLIVSRDISERKRAEQEIRKLAAFAQLNPNPVFEFLADGTLSYYNDAALEMAESLQQEHPQAILPLNSASIIQMCLATERNRLHIRTSIKRRTFVWSFFPIVASQMVHCYAEEITESLNMEAQFRQVQKMESVGQLAAGVAHDFNNILTIIQGHAGLMLTDSGLNSILADSAQQISLAAERAANLTRQLLMFSRKQVMQPRLLDLNEVIANVFKMLRALAGDQVTVRRNTAADIPPIHADPGMLEQVLVNLAVNSRDAMPRGGQLSISTFAKEINEAYVLRQPEARTGYYVGLSISDTGHGMDSATLGRIFEPFFTTKEIGKGTGLGLATVYGIVKQHHGWVEVESQVGRGTTFTIFIPASTKSKPAHETVQPEAVPGGNETILVVEDELSLRELVEEILRKKGYKVLQAPTGAQALKVWQEHKNEIDLLLTDMMMPEGVSGRELAEKVLAEKPRLKVIYSSGYSVDVVGPGYCLEEGSNYLQKPYQPETLVRAVRNRLDSVQ